jgi:predicted ATPase
MKNQPRTNRLRGREVEWGVVLDLLDGTRRGKGGVLLVEGEPGSGKTTLLAAAAEVAGDHGFVLGTSDADELARFTPLAPLRAAMPGAVAGPARRPVVTRARWQTGNLRVRLEELASAGPMLLALDGLNWADPATLHALRSLPGRLAHYPLAWILARSSHGGSREAGLVFETLMHAGAVRAVLQPLPEETQVAVMADVLGGVPDADLVERAGCAAGNPFLLTEFLSGLLDENAVNVTEGRVSLVSRRIPGGIAW